MINHRNFIAHLNRIFTRAMLEKSAFRASVALQTLEYGVQEIGIHTRNTDTKPPALLRIEREIFREAYTLQKLQQQERKNGA